MVLSRLDVSPERIAELPASAAEAPPVENCDRASDTLSVEFSTELTFSATN